MKTLFLLITTCFLLAPTTHAQRVYLADTGFVTDPGAGYGGAPASCQFGGGASIGFSMSRTYDYWDADAFTIPADSTWVFDTVILYAYQHNSSLVSPFVSCNLEIYNAAPGIDGSVIWGDSTTNVLATTGWTGIYRVDTVTADGGLLSTERPVMYLKLHLNPAPVLGAGTYWLAWSATGSAGANVYSPEKVAAGRTNPPGQMARRYNGTTWNYISDNANSIGMDMIIEGHAGITGVPAINTAATLSQNSPNPFGNTTDITFYTATAGYATLCVYNTIGQLVTTLVDGNIAAGTHVATFDAATLPAGIYYYRLNTTNGSQSNQMLLKR